MRVRGFGIAIAALALALPATSIAAKGDVYVTDVDDGVWKLGPDGGEAQELASGSPLDVPIGMAMNRDGSLLVANNGGEAILGVDRESGAVSTFAPLPGSAFDVAVGADKMIYATVETPTDTLVRIHPLSREVSTVTSDLGDNPTGLALTRKGIAFVANFIPASIQVIDTRDGSQASPLSDPLLEGPEGLALSPDERFLYAAGVNSNNLVRFDVRTGEAVEVADLGDARAVSLFSDRSFLVSESDLGPGVITRVGQFGSPLEVFSDDPDLGFPHETVIEPKRCGGKFPTVVGTTGRDKLKGSKYADVISTLGGNDKVNAGKGKDIVCGGKGKDKLKGGKGRDKLKGGKGKDKLIGGPGKDVERQ